MMTSIVPLARNHTAGVDDAHYLDAAIDAYKDYLSGEFTDTWPDALETYGDDRVPIVLVAKDTASPPEGAVILVDDDADVDDVHYLNWAIVEVYKKYFSGEFTRLWPQAFETYRNNLTAISFAEGEVVESEDAPELSKPEIDNDLPKPPRPSGQPWEEEATQLPADTKEAKPKPTQY